MIGLLGFFAIWAIAAWRGLRTAQLFLAMAVWWGAIVCASLPNLAPALADWIGGDIRLWLMLGPIALIILTYRWGLQKLRAKAQAKDPAPAAVTATEKPLFEPEEVARYSRHLFLREIGGQGQQRLKNAKVLVVGAGGLGAPVLMYLAAAGVGEITLVDDDLVEASNLQRQIIHRQEALGRPKVVSAAAMIEAQNPYVTVIPLQVRLDEENAAALIAGKDLVLDGTDNFDSRYLVNRICAAHQVPLIAGAMTQWEGQLSLYDPARGGPCYECVFPTRPAAGLVPACSEAGVAAPLPGVMGSLMALEAVKHLTHAGEGLRGRLMLYDGLYGQSRMVKTKHRADCAICGQKA